MIVANSRRKAGPALFGLTMLCLACVALSAAQDKPGQTLRCPPDCPHMRMGPGPQPDPAGMPGPKRMGMQPGMGGMMAPRRMDQVQPPLGTPMPSPIGGIAGQGITSVLRRPAIQKELGVTEEQRKKLEEIDFNSSKTGIQQRAALQVLHLELGRLMQADNPDRVAIDKKIGELSQAQSAQMRAMVNARLDLQNVLTKEQREKAKNLLRQQVAPRIEPMPAGRMRLRQRVQPALPSPDRPAPNPPPVQ